MPSTPVALDFLLASAGGGRVFDFEFRFLNLGFRVNADGLRIYLSRFGVEGER